MQRLKVSGAVRLIYRSLGVKGLNAELNPICHLQTLLGAHHILHVSGIRGKWKVVSSLKMTLPAVHHHFTLTLGDSRKMRVAFPCFPGVTSGPVAACKGVTASVCVRSCLPCFAGPSTLG